MKTTEIQVDRPTSLPNLPNPEPLKLRPFDWQVITPETVPEGDDWVFLAITPRDYETLSLNTAELMRFIREAMWRLRYYRGELPQEKTK